MRDGGVLETSVRSARRGYFWDRNFEELDIREGLVLWAKMGEVERMCFGTEQFGGNRVNRKKRQYTEHYLTAYFEHLTK